VIQVVGIAEMKVSRTASDVLVTYSLGSCVGVTMYDPRVRAGGLIHCMLPFSTIDPEKAVTRPEMFTDTGLTLLLQKLFDLGAEKRTLIVKVAGAARLLDANGVFRIGERNIAVLEKVLEKNGIPIAGEDVGGTVARTMSLHLSSGKTVLKISGKESVL
jgi:chemotaxis protein CheD